MPQSCPNVRRLSLAGLVFEISGEGYVPGPVADPAYREFQPDQRPCGEDVIAVRIRTGGLPEPRVDELIFDAAGTWAAYANGDRRLVVRRFLPEGRPEILAEARFFRSRPGVEIFCPVSERQGTVGDRPVALESPLQYPLDQVLIMYLLAGSGVVVHAAGAVRGGLAYCFAGCSGAGKSTIARLLEAAGGWDVLSDDRVVLRRSGEGFALHGTPWPGEGLHAKRRSAPLAGILHLCHGAEPRLDSLEPRAAAARLYPVAGIPWFDADTLPSHLDFCRLLARSVPAWLLTFRLDETTTDLLAKRLS